VHGLLLELEEAKLWEEQLEQARKGGRRPHQPPPLMGGADDDEERLWAAAERAARGALDDADEGDETGGSYEPKLTGDPVIDHLEQQLARGEEPDWNLLE
jgi:hypothetical protein